MEKLRIRRFLILIAILFISGSAWAEGPAGQLLDVKLNILNGQVKLTRVGKTLSDVLNTGCSLSAGDLVETLRESKAELLYGDGTAMRIKPLTMVEVQLNSLKIFKGQSWFKFTKRGTEFVIETPSLVAGIRGTVFDVSVSSRGRSVLSVMEGAVAIKGKSSTASEVTVKAGFASHCDSSQTPVTPYKFNEARKALEWKEMDWISGKSNDLNQLYLNYSNLRKEYGEEDPRTIEARTIFEEAQKTKQITHKSKTKSADLKSEKK